MIRPALLCGQILLAAALLTACGKRAGSNVAAEPSLETASGRPEDQFGKGFGTAFRADPRSEPANVSENDVVPVSMTAEPVDIP